MAVPCSTATFGETNWTDSVFASSFAIFATGRCWEQLRNSVAATRANVKVVASHGGLTVGPDGLSHQCVEDISLMRTIPHFAVIVPCDWLEAKKAVLAAARMKGPVYIRTARPKTAQVTAEETPFAIGPEFYATRSNRAEAQAFETVRRTLRERGERIGSVGYSIGLWRIR